MSIRTFALGVAKITGAIVVSVIILAGLLAAWYWISTQREAARNKPLATKRTWERPFLNNEASCSVASAWRDGRLFLQVDLAGLRVDQVLTDDNANVSVEFYDGDQFKLFSHDIAWNQFATIQPSKPSRPAAKLWKGDTYVSADGYRRVANVSCLWAGIVERPEESAAKVSSIPSRRPAAPPAPWRSRANWRRLDQGLSEETVRQILGEPTHIQKFGPTLTNWRYGEVLFGGTVSFSGGQVTSWDEPSQ